MLITVFHQMFDNDSAVIPCERRTSIFILLFGRYVASRKNTIGMKDVSC